MDVIRRRVPVSKWLPNYKAAYFFKDLLAGFTVALTEIPQGIAYAGVAGLPARYGLYSGFMGCFVYFVLGTCKDLNIGPTSILSLMIQPYVLYFGPPITGVITLLGGAVIFALGVLNLGFLVEFFSYPIISGFTSAGALQIAASQFNPLLGIPKKASDFIPAIRTVFTNLDQIRYQDATLGFASILLLVAIKESCKSTPSMRDRNYRQTVMFLLFLARNALVVIIGTALAYFLRDENGTSIFKITGHIEKGFPPVAIPSFAINGNNTGTILSKLGTTTVFLPLVAILETVAIAKAFNRGRTLDATQEMFAVGFCNIMGSLVGSMPVTGSFTRTAVNNASGVKTTAGGVVTGLIVILALGFLTDIFYFIPKASLAAVIVCAMIYLFHYEAFVLIYRSRRLDLIPLTVTFLVCLFWSLENGTLIGIFTNLIFVLYGTARPKMRIEKFDDAYVITPKSTLYFPSAEHLRTIVLERDGDVVINGRNIDVIDITLAKSLSVLYSELKERNRRFLLLDFEESVKTVVERTDNRLSDLFVNKIDHVV